jgi:rhodanese-related sulfurtransferase
MKNATGFRIFFQSAVLIVAATAIGLAVNLVRPGGLPLVALRSDIPPDSDPGKPRAVTLEHARELLFSENAVFLDARPPNLYRQGHILGARNLPPGATEEDLRWILEDIPKNFQIIVYCDGPVCDRAVGLAQKISGKGYRNTGVLKDGWTQWSNRGLPGE